MAVEKLEIETYFGKCKCCLSYGYLRTMWEQHVVEDEIEIYGQMLTKCFSIAWTIQGTEEEDQICEDCIWKLREACTFKKQVLQTQIQLEYFEDGEKATFENDDTDIKTEPDDEGYVVEYLEEDVLENNNDNSLDEEIHGDKESFEDDIQDDDDEIQDDDDVIFKDEDYDENEIPQGEDDEDFVTSSPAPRKRKYAKNNQEGNESDCDTDTPKTKWPKKLPKEERWKTYKQYTEDELKKAVEVVVAKRMNQKQAAKLYHVPRKTLSAKVLAIKSDEHETERPLTPSKDEIKGSEIMLLLTKHRQNIHSVLAYSNATPIRGYWGVGYACVFCPQQYADASNLKKHTLSQHITENYKVKHLRTHLVKLDITGLKCEVCNTKFDKLETFMLHLKAVHDKPMHFDIKNHIVPYKFENNILQCVKCWKHFNNFKNISEHMNNEHFRNFECDKCTRGFVNKSTLITHGSRHRTGEFACLYCKKIFNTRLRKTEHERIIHFHNSKTRKCGYCSEKFVDVSQKIKHEVVIHKMKQPEFQCYSCDRKFASQRILQGHIKNVHLMHRPYKCTVIGCDKAYFVNAELTAHLFTHGDIKPFACALCPKSYKSKKALSAHMHIHDERRDYECGMCSKRFVVKENLELHLEKVHYIQKENADALLFPSSHTSQFLKEIKTLLTYFTATPFRTRAHRPHCFYCVQPDFTTAEELRLHTQSQHPDLIHRLEILMRPSWNNEMIKLDIQNISCRVCNTRFLQWADVLEHLKIIHKITFQYKNKMIPYFLDNDRYCAICHEKFTAFTLLETHLNKHYRNYTCEYCGDPFITALRLKAHEKIHDTGRFACVYCSKVFSLEIYMKKHVSFVHSNELKVKCRYCSDVFKNDHQRQAHVVVSHVERLESITCELCGTMFSWMRHFVRHMKRTHGTEHRCNQCGTFFASEKLLKEHEVRHTGVKKYKCLVCFKSYFSLPSLKSHMKYLHKRLTELL